MDIQSTQFRFRPRRHGAQPRPDRAHRAKCIISMCDLNAVHARKHTCTHTAQTNTHTRFVPFSSSWAERAYDAMRCDTAIIIIIIFEYVDVCVQCCGKVREFLCRCVLLAQRLRCVYIQIYAHRGAANGNKHSTEHTWHKDTEWKPLIRIQTELAHKIIPSFNAVSISLFSHC